MQNLSGGVSRLFIDDADNAEIWMILLLSLNRFFRPLVSAFQDEFSERLDENT